MFSSYSYYACRYRWCINSKDRIKKFFFSRYLFYYNVLITRDRYNTWYRNIARLSDQDLVFGWRKYRFPRGVVAWVLPWEQRQCHVRQRPLDVCASRRPGILAPVVSRFGYDIIRNESEFLSSSVRPTPVFRTVVGNKIMRTFGGVFVCTRGPSRRPPSTRQWREPVSAYRFLLFILETTYQGIGFGSVAYDKHDLYTTETCKHELRRNVIGALRSCCDKNRCVHTYGWRMP